jgi:SET family sugar efflux transporter-like MFS transporter
VTLDVPSRTRWSVGRTLLASVAAGVPLLVAGQILNAFFIAAVTGLSISYLQDMLPTQPGRTTTMFTNSYPIGSVLAGPLFGLAQAFGFRWAFVFSVLCGAGLAILLVVRPRATFGGRVRLAASQ